MRKAARRALHRCVRLGILRYYPDAATEGGDQKTGHGKIARWLANRRALIDATRGGPAVEKG